MNQHKDDLKAIAYLTANSFPDEVLHLTKDEPEAKKIFLQVENSYAKFVEDQVKIELEKLGHVFINSESLVQFMEQNCEIKRDEQLPNPLNILYLDGKFVCSWNDFADVIGHVAKRN